MERERELDRERKRSFDDGPPSSNGLDAERREIDALLASVDHVFDAMSNLQAQQYLEQNLQTGGQ